jgi:anti-sigma regulatory factor (Ser/Thr protein kinase)
VELRCGEATLPYAVPVPASSPATAPEDPRAPLGHLSRLGPALVGAAGIDDIARTLITDLSALPGVSRVGFALTEGGGRRLRFTASDRAPDGPVDWCHIDAYDDVPLTRVVRTGEPVIGHKDSLDQRYDAFVARQPDEVQALAAVPLPGVGSPIGGLIVFLEQEWREESQRRLLEATARRTADAVRRVRVVDVDALEEEPEPDEDSPLTARIVLEGDPRSAGLARRFLRDFLGRFDVPEEVSETAQLCLSELVTNAVLHAGTRSELRATLDADLTVSVRDRGRASPDQPAPDGDPDLLRVHGRGLMLVEALSDRWGSERDAAGTTMWFSLKVG